MMPAMDDYKFQAFLKVAVALQPHGITPLLCGSLGLERVTKRGWDPGDIDIVVPGDPRGWYAPDEDRIYQWPEIQAVMEGLGYRLVDLHEHAFEDDGGLRVEFGDLDTFPDFAGIDLADIKRVETDGVAYFLLTPRQYLALYEASLQDSYRADGDNHKDEPKIAFLRQRLVAESAAYSVDPVLERQELIDLYDAVGWTSYTETPDNFGPMYANAALVIAARLTLGLSASRGRD